MACLAWDEMASKPLTKQKNCDATTEIFGSKKYSERKKHIRKGIGMRAKKQLNKCKPTWINLGGYNTKIEGKVSITMR